jgi:hypothetical protein
MIRMVIGVFFFGLLGVCLSFAAVGILGFQVVDISQKWTQITILGIFALAGISLWICFKIQSRRSRREIKNILHLHKART